MHRDARADQRREVRDRVDSGSICLSFDDGPDPESTPLVLRALAEAGARATFFVIPGRHPELIERIVGAGHEVGYHCRLHVRHSDRTRDQVAGEAAEDLFWLSELDAAPSAWRTPWGDLADWTPRLAAELGLQLWLWSDDSEDWAGHSATGMLTALEATIGGGSTVLMHDGLGPGSRRGDCEETARLIPLLLAAARKRGLSPVRISAGEPSRAGGREGTTPELAGA